MGLVEKILCTDIHDDKFHVCEYAYRGHLVRVIFDKDWNPVRYTCDCKAYAMGKRCRHIYAVMNKLGIGVYRSFLIASGVEP